jgi:hypothetical protein
MTATPSNTASAASRRYLIRFGAAMASYVILLIIAILWAKGVGESPWRFVAMALPVPVLVAVVWAVVAYLREADEFLSRTTIESLAIAFAGGSLTTFTYGLMQFVGAPVLNWTFVWVVYAMWWIIAGVVVRRRYR